MEFLRDYSSLIISLVSVAFGYGVLSNRMKQVESQLDDHDSVLKTQAVILQQIAVDVAIIRTKLEDIKNK